MWNTQPLDYAKNRILEFYDKQNYRIIWHIESVTRIFKVCGTQNPWIMQNAESLNGTQNH